MGIFSYLHLVFYMPLKAVLFDFNGVIIKDESIHLKLIDEILVEENLQPQKPDERLRCLGRSDRACFEELLNRRGRVVSQDYLTQLLRNKANKYIKELESLEQLPLYSGIEDLIIQAQSQNLPVGLVSGALGREIELVLERANIREYFQVIIAGDDIATSKPQPEGYLLAVDRLNQLYSDTNVDLSLKPENCLALEDTLAGIEAAKRAGMKVVGIANTYPFHILQRQANWTVDHVTDLEWERIWETFEQKDLKNGETLC
jgi:HAD superfamily hydrolase (TIGR01509 family)